MIQRHRRDHRGERRRNHVGGIKTSSQANLEQNHIGWVAREEVEHPGGGDFELGDRPPCVDLLHLDKCIGEFVLVDKLTAAELSDADALVEADEMRRRVDVDPFAGSLQHCPHERRRRALAVSAGDMDDRRQTVFRMAKVGHQPLDALERQVNLPRMECQEALQDGARTIHAGNETTLPPQAGWRATRRCREAGRGD